MDILDKNLLKFWSALNVQEVKYIMVGGFAVNMHGFSRATADIDVWIKDEPSNRVKFGNALSEFGYEKSLWEKFQFVPGWSDIAIGAGIRLDIMTTMKGLESISFEEAEKYAAMAEIKGVLVPFLHINHLIANKNAINRSKDQLDVIELKKIIEIRKEMGLDQKEE